MRIISIIIGYSVLFTSHMFLPRDQVIRLGMLCWVAFPVLVQVSTPLQSLDMGTVKKLGVILILLLSIAQMLVKGETKQFYQAGICILVSNSLLFIPRKTAAVVEQVPSLPLAITSIEKMPVQDPAGASQENGLAELGDGNMKPLSPEQVKMCNELCSQMRALFKQEVETLEGINDFLDPEACRRFLVARGWDLKKAHDQLREAIKWKLKSQPWTKPFHQVSLCRENPYAMNMRIVGFDNERRPIVLTGFTQAHNRHNTEKNIEHFEALLEAGASLIRRQFRDGVTRNASALQWILVIDFVGFGFRDCNPKTGYLAGSLMARYPEMLNMALFIDAPRLFSSMWSAVSSVIDDRVRAKISFVSFKTFQDKLKERLGEELSTWLEKEISSSRSFKGRREYWKVQADGHDPRGTKTYVESPYYIKTPGEEYEEHRS